MPNKNYSVGNLPPQVLWTVVRGDSAVFRVYVTDDNRQPLNIDEWQIDIEIKRGDNVVIFLKPEAEEGELPGYFSVKLTPFQSELLQTKDLFDIQLWDFGETVWTIAQGEMNIIEDITSAPFGSEES